MFTWRRLSKWAMGITALFWVAATYLGWVHSVVLVNHLSFFAIFLAFYTAYRADSPTKDGGKHE